MLLENNPDLDAAGLAKKIEHATQHRRRPQPLFSSAALTEDDIVPAASEELPLDSSVARTEGGVVPAVPEALAREPRLRDAIKRIPVLGDSLLYAYRRARQIAAPGLQLKHRVALLPLIGSALVWVNGIVRLNGVRQQIANEFVELRHAQYEQNASALRLSERLDQMDRTDIANRLTRIETLDIGTRLAQLDAIGIAVRLNDLEAQTQLHLTQQAQRHLELQAQVRGFQDTVQALQQAMQISAESVQALRESVKALSESEKASSETVQDMQKRIGERDNRIAGLTRELRRYVQFAASGAAASGVRAASADAPAALQDETDLNSFYVEFEDFFRGAPDDISERLSVYLPYLAPFAGIPGARVVDIGCGRGEWLRLAAAQGFEAIGIDLNAVMVENCRAQGLTAECDDAIAYLGRQLEGSLAVITGFHIIEHLPFATLIALFDAALHALRTDGLIIFETPNAENLLVGACNFYNDPTHQRPIVPAVAEFMAVQRGFAHARILRLHPYPDIVHVQEDSEIARRFNAAMYGSQDYALLAWKTHAN